MSEILNDTSDHGADEVGSEDTTRGRHRGLLASDDSNESSNPHGRHRMEAAAN
jgi:hypothetical protein